MRNIKDVIINGVTLEEILNKHEKWLNGEEDGKRAELNNVDLSCVNLSGVNLSKAYLYKVNLSKSDLTNANLSDTNLNCADLYNADLRGAYLINTSLKYSDLRRVNLNDANLSYVDLNYANLKGADLSYANLRGADLTYAILRRANLSYANLSEVDLTYANLREANLIGTNLGYADLSCADLTDAILIDANLKGIEYNTSTTSFALQCPEKGSFIGYKKANNKIVELLITEDSKRSSATSRKCRCSKAKVLSITNIENTKEYDEVASDFNYSFVYRVDEIVEVEDFDENRWEECSTGIHFFMTRDEAVNY